MDTFSMYTRSVSGVMAFMVSKPAATAPAVAMSLIQMLTRGTRGWMARRLAMNSRTTKTEGETTSGPVALPDLCRLEGINLLQLPPNVAAAKVAIPARFAATGSYLMQYGRSATGIFRIPGKQRVITALYNHFSDHIKAAEASDCYIELTVRASSLPNDVSFDVHDIASTFKKFLGELPGGILGSLRLFDALRYIMTLKYDEHESVGPNETSTNAKFIAYSLLKLESSDRLALISAVFGLLAHLSSEPHSSTSTHHTSFTSTHQAWEENTKSITHLSQAREQNTDAPFSFTHHSREENTESSAHRSWEENTKISKHDISPTFTHPHYTRGENTESYTSTRQTWEENTKSSAHQSWEENTRTTNNTTTERMTPHALAVIFAPLLLGNLTDLIRLDPTSSGAEDLDSFLPSAPTSACSPCDTLSHTTSEIIGHLSARRHASPTFQQLYAHPFEETSVLASTRPGPQRCATSIGAPARKAAHARSASLEHGLRRTALAAALIEMVLTHWQGVVKELRRHDAQGNGCFLPWPSAPNAGLRAQGKQGREDSGVGFMEGEGDGVVGGMGEVERAVEYWRARALRAEAKLVV